MCTPDTGLPTLMAANGASTEQCFEWGIKSIHIFNEHFCISYLYLIKTHLWDLFLIFMLIIILISVRNT